MGINDLKLIENVTKTSPDVSTRRRAKLIQTIDKQLSALLGNPLRLPTRNRWIFLQADGTYQLVVMYGRKPLELAKGRHGIACSSVEQLIAALKVVKQTVSDGKLDKQIELAADAIRSGFKKK